MNSKKSKSIVVIVAHPDDETLWAGGTILNHPTNKWFIVTLCRASDPDRSARFYNALKLLKSEGIMGDLDDGPTQEPLDENELEEYILQLLPATHFDLIITHSPKGEYTRHLRHEEVNKAVTTLWRNGKLSANELWTFAYEDGNKAYFPRAIEQADVHEVLSEQIWLNKYKLITETYGFGKDSWEAETTPQAEAFWQFRDPQYTQKSIRDREKDLNLFKSPDLDALKSIYYKSKNYLNDKTKRDKEKSLFTQVFEPLKDPKKQDTSAFDFGNELRIFNKPSLDALKFLYHKSFGYVFQKESWNFEKPLISKTINALNKNHRAKKTLNKIGYELRIFNRISIESLKLLYSKTDQYLEGSKLPDEQPSSI